MGASWQTQPWVSIPYRGMKPHCVPQLLYCHVSPTKHGWGPGHLKKKKFPDSLSICHVSTMSLRSPGLRVFSVWVGSVGLLGKLKEDLLWKQKNKSEQISLIIVGSGKNHILFSFLFLQDCLRGDAPPTHTLPPPPPARLCEGQERTGTSHGNQGFSCISPITFPINPQSEILADSPPLLLQGSRQAERHSPSHNCTGHNA